MQPIFFDYASYEAICTVALPITSEIAAESKGRDVPVPPLVCTVDTGEKMDPALDTHAPRRNGLTGGGAARLHVRELFHVERKVLFEEPPGGTVYAHGSHNHVMDGSGAFLTLLPPILSVDRMVEIVEGHAVGL